MPKETLFKKPTAANYTFLNVCIYFKLISTLSETQQTPIRSTEVPMTTQELFYIQRMEEWPLSETENCGKVKRRPQLLPQLKEPPLPNWDLHKKGQLGIIYYTNSFPHWETSPLPVQNWFLSITDAV